MSEYLTHERGRRLLSWREVLNQHARLIGQPTFRPPKRWWQPWRWFKPDEPLVIRKSAEPTFTWAGLPLPAGEATTHFAIFGATGSGKSLLIQELLEDFVPQVTRLPDQRAFLYDAKGDLYPKVSTLAPNCILFDPFDERGVAWDLAADVRTPAEARQLASALVPSIKSGTDTFWENATRNVLAAVIEALIRLTQGRWTLRDVLLVMRSAERIAALLEACPETAHVWRNCQGDDKTRANLLASFASYLHRYEVVAALWERTRTKFGLRRWVHEAGGIVLVRNHPRYRETLAPIHRLLFDLMADELLSQPDSRARRTWFVLDEVRSLGRLERLVHVTNEGRSKGVCVVLGLQSVEGFHEVYGKELGNEIIGQCRNKTFLRTDSAATARWIEEHFGQVQVLVEQRTSTSTHGPGGAQRGSSVTHSRRRESLILGSELMKLPPPKPGGTVTLLNDVPSIGSYLCFYSFDALLAGQVGPRPDAPALVERPARQQQMEEWSAKDLRRLKLPPVQPAQTEPDTEYMARLKRLGDGESSDGKA